MSTGYNAYVYMEQGSTKLVASSGFSAAGGGEIEIHNAAQLNVSSGGTINLSSGAKITDQSFTNSTINNAVVPNYGVTVIAPSSDCATRLRRPTKGLRKTIIINSTELISIKSTAASCTGPAWCIGSTGAPMHSVICCQGSTMTFNFGFDLIGAATNLWHMIGIPGSSAAGKKGQVYFATAT